MKLSKTQKANIYMLGICVLVGLIIWFLAYNSDHAIEQRAWDALPEHVKQERIAEKHRKARVYQTLKFQFQRECIETISEYGEVSSEALDECYSMAWRNAEKIVDLGLEGDYE